MPNGNAGSRNPSSPSQVFQSKQRHRHRCRRRHGPPPPEPDDAGGDEAEGAESEVRTNDPTVGVTPAGSVNYQRHGQPRQGDRHAGGQAGGHQQADQIESFDSCNSAIG